MWMKWKHTGKRTKITTTPKRMKIEEMEEEKKTHTNRVTNTKYDFANIYGSSGNHRHPCQYLYKLMMNSWLAHIGKQHKAVHWSYGKVERIEFDVVIGIHVWHCLTRGYCSKYSHKKKKSKRKNRFFSLFLSPRKNLSMAKNGEKIIVIYIQVFFVDSLLLFAIYKTIRLDSVQNPRNGHFRWTNITIINLL